MSNQKETGDPRRQLGSLAWILLLVFLSALAYLPLVGRFGYYNDDWYLMYAAKAYGPEVFREIFSVDRPARALVMIPAYTLFGENALLYNLSAYLFRVLAAVSLFWLLRMLWPSLRRLAFLAALLFLVYPGFLSQPNGIDYQSQMVSLAAALLSIALSVQAALLSNRVQKGLAFLGAVLLGWLYLGLVEYFIGLELLRLGSFYILEGRKPGSFRERGVAALRRWLPNLIIPLGFLAWRLFFFESERGATDVDLQLGQFRLYPLQTLYHWAVQVLQDLFDVLLSAWVIPLYQLRGAIEAWGVILSLAAVGLLVFLLYRSEADRAGKGPAEFSPIPEVLALGLLATIGGLIPIAMVNREVMFPAYSRYSLAASVGAAILIAGLLCAIKQRALRYSILGLLLLTAMLTQHANSVKFAREASIVRNFWWQVAWRVPQLAERTTLVGSYPQAAIEEDYFLWGPASLIYYPSSDGREDIQPGLFAAILNKDTVAKIQARERQEYDKRKNIITYKNYRNVLALSQPSLEACMHVIDGQQPVYSLQELESIRAIGPFSETDHILLEEAPHTPPAAVFGPEPDHDWCYYYQKADLARQRGDWDTVLALGEEAFRSGLTPADEIEWLPFLQAYAQAGDGAKLIELAPRLTAHPYVAAQACQLLNSMPGLSDTVVTAIDSLYCID